MAKPIVEVECGPRAHMTFDLSAYFNEPPPVYITWEAFVVKSDEEKELLVRDLWPDLDLEAGKVTGKNRRQRKNNKSGGK